MKRLSFIIPAYNCEKFIKQCIDSLSIADEIIVINDGSTDNTYNILKDYPNIKLININNHGVSYARNLGIRTATGEYIMFVDADDYILDCSTIFSGIDFNNAYDILYFSKNMNLNADKSLLFEHISGIKQPCLAGPCSKLYRRKFLIDNNLYFKEDLINGEDMLFNIECLSKANKYLILNKSFYMYRQIISSATKSFNVKIMESDKKFLIYLKALLLDINIDDHLKNTIINFSYCNGIVTLLDRSSYLKCFSKYKKIINYIKKEDYDKHISSNDYLRKSSRIVLFLYKCKLYYLLFVAFKIKHKKLKDKEIFIKI